MRHDHTDETRDVIHLLPCPVALVRHFLRGWIHAQHDFESERGQQLANPALIHLAGGSLRTSTRTYARSEHDLSSGGMLIQTRGGGYGE